MFGLFARAYAGLALTPFERAVIRFLQGLAGTFTIAAAPVLAQVLAAQGVPADGIQWAPALEAAAAAGALAVYQAMLKYFSAKSDVPLPVAAAPTVPPMPANPVVVNVQPATAPGGTPQ